MDFHILAELYLLLETTKLDLDASFIQNGGHSLSAAALVAAAKVRGCHLTTGNVLTSHSLRDVLLSAQPFTKSNSSIPPSEEISSNSLNTFSSESAALTKHPSNKRYYTDIATPSEYDGFFTHELPVFSPIPLNLGRSKAVAEFPYPTPEISPTPSPPIEANPGIKSQLDSAQSPLPAQLEFSSLPEPQDNKPTKMQLSLIHGTLKSPGTNIITHSETYYSDDIPTMKAAWKTVIEMEPIFGDSSLTKFLEEDRKVFDWYDAVESVDDQSKALEGLLQENRIGSFFQVVTCTTPPGLRSRSTIIWIVHHALIDGYSAALVFDKVRKVANGMKVQPGPPFSQLVRDLEIFKESHRDEGDSYWLRKLGQSASAKTELMLPFVDGQNGQARTAEVVVDYKPFAGKLHSTALDINVTPTAFFYAAWALVLATYSDSNTISFGAVQSGRNLPLPNVAAVVGPFVNTLPLFVDIDRTAFVKEFIRSVFENLVELADFQWTNPENKFSRNFESALSLQFAQPVPLQAAVAPIEKPLTQQTMDIPLSIAVEADGIIRFAYHCNRFSRKNVDRLTECYLNALQLLLQTHSNVESVMTGLLSSPSKALLTSYGNCASGLTTKGSVKDDLVTLFETAARKYPDNVAIERGELSITYRDFDRASGRVALRLSRLISPGDVVCVHSDRSVNWLIALYGILKARGIYCSLDSSLPCELRKSMYTLSGAEVYLTPFTDQLELTPASCKSCFSVQSSISEIDGPDQSVLGHRQEPEPWSTAYLCFTSGSSGTPKGVLCTHEGLVAFQSDLEVRLFAQPGTKVSQIMSPAFDGSIHELFSALSYGATLVLQAGGDPFAHLNCVDSAILTPSLARVLNPQDYRRLSTVYLVGEPVPQAVADKWSTHKQLYNMYGPTEGTCGATIKRLTPGNPVTIGGPNPTTRIYLLNSRKDMVMPGMVGEIYLAGIQIAKGYLNLPNETNERFLPDTICCNGEQMYKTGDRGYWNELGEIVCLGRNDREIKLRGYRLDMNDLEIRIAKAIPTLEGIAIGRLGDHLVAMIQPASTNIKDFVSQIGKVLPWYAIPDRIHAVDRLPTTPAGKIDYAAVSQNSSAMTTNQTGAPRTTTERAVAAAFKMVLELDKSANITLGSSFIDLGGHSLQQLSLTKQLTKIFKLQIPLQLIIARPKLEDLANSIDDYKTKAKPTIPPSRCLGHQQVSPIEKEWLQKYEIDAGSSCFNVCFTSSFVEGTVDRYALSEAWNTTLARHRLLRSQYVARRARPATRHYAICAPVAERVSDVNLWVEVNRPFQLTHTNPARVLITKDRLIVVLSHIVADYTTLAILLREASAVYNGKQLESIPQSYCDAHVWYRTVPPCYLDFWTEYLENCPDTPPVLGRQQERSGYRGVSIVSLIDSNTFQGMLKYSQSAKISLQQLVMGAVAICLQLDSPKTDVVIGNPYINRNSDNDLETVGLFLEPLPIRIKYDPIPADEMESGERETYIQAVQRSSQAALANAVPWHQLLDHLSIHPTYPDHPLLDVMVTFHDSRQSLGLDMAIPGCESCFIWSQGSKFKLMCEFTAISDNKLLLRLEYDPECISAVEIEQIQSLIPQALSLLSQNVSHDEIKRHLSKGDLSTYHRVMDINDLFGMRLCDIE